MTASVSSRPGRLQWLITRGNDFAYTLTFKDADGVVIDKSGATFTAKVLTLGLAEEQTLTIDDSDAATGILVVSGTDTLSSALTGSDYRWRLDETNGTLNTTLLDGAFLVAAPGKAGVVSGSSSATVTISQAADVTVTCTAGGTVSSGGGGGSGAPTDATYLVTTANSDLSAEVVVGATPGGELGGTWASPTVDTTHSGSSHAATQAAAEATASAALSAHESDTTSVHGIADTSALLDTADIGVTVQGYDSDLAALASAGNSSVLAATTASFLTADETKLDGIEALADVTDSTNVDAAGAVMNSDTSTASMSFVVDEDAMTSDSATKVPTQQSVKAYADGKVSDTAYDASSWNGVAGVAPSKNAVRDQVELLAPKASPTFTGTPTVPGYLPLAAGGASVENVGAIESNVNTVATTGSTETLDTSLYAVHDCTMDQACTFSFSNPAPSGKNTTFMLILRGAFTPTLPASVDWGDASAPTYSTPSIYVFTTVDAGTTWLGSQVAKAVG